MLAACLCLPFIRSQGANGQGVNLVANDCAKALIYELVTRKWSLARKFVGDHKRFKVRIIVTENLDDRTVEPCFDQATYLDWIHIDLMLR